MEEKKDNKKESIWVPVILFYTKITAWIIGPLLLAIFVGDKFQWLFMSDSYLDSRLILISFAITCFGIYKEIKQYKKDLTKEDTK